MNNNDIQKQTSNERFTGEIQKVIAGFIVQEGNKQSLITVTSVTMQDKSNLASVGISVLPESQEAIALKFVQRRAHDMLQKINATFKHRRAPKLIFHIDKGEKNRYAIDAILREEGSENDVE
jgi:ribosome-binding factor A